jgi:hypothetical protein
MMDWLVDPANSAVVRAVLTLIASIIAALTALIIAFTAYPWQRKLDRDSEVRKERRQLYSSVVEVFDSYAEDIERIGRATDENKRAWANVFHKVLIYAPAEVAKAIFEYTASEVELSIQCFETNTGKDDDENQTRHRPVMIKQKDMIVRMREDLHINSNSQGLEVETMLARFNIGN